MIYMTFLGVFWACFLFFFLYKRPQNTPWKSHIDHILGRAQIRWVIWRSSNFGRDGTDLFSRRFREGIAFPNFVEKPILTQPLSKLCAVPFALQYREHFAKRSEERKGAERKGERRGWRDKKEKRDAWELVSLQSRMKNLIPIGNFLSWLHIFKARNFSPGFSICRALLVWRNVATAMAQRLIRGFFFSGNSFPNGFSGCPALVCFAAIGWQYFYADQPRLVC